jgi:hypothetical protein
MTNFSQQGKMTKGFKEVRTPKFQNKVNDDLPKNIKIA